MIYIRYKIYIYIYMNFSGALGVSVGSVQFQIAPHSSFRFSISTVPFRCSRCYRQGDLSDAPVLSEAVPFVYLASVCRSLQCPTSALTQAGGGGPLFRLLVPSCCREGLVLLSPKLLRLLAVLYGACPALHAVPALACSTKARNKKPCLLFVPSLSERLRQPGA